MIQKTRPDLSIIVAVFNEDSRNLLKLIDRLALVLSPEKISYEIVFVNDGSREPTTNALKHIAVESNNIKLIELSRNFGQQAAITAGLDYAEGNAVVNMDSDLQDPPELIPKMIAKWKEGFDVVYATRAKRRDRLSKRFTAFAFYRILGAMSTVDIPWDTGDFRLMDRVVVDALRSLPEKTRFIRGMIPWLGFKQCGVPLDRDAREIGESAYTVKKLLCLALDGMLLFSSAPLFLILGLGGSLTVITALVFTGSLIASGFVINNLVLLTAMALFVSIQITVLGVIAVYLSKMLDEVRARPTYIVAKKIGGGFLTAEKSPIREIDENTVYTNQKTVQKVNHQ